MRRYSVLMSRDYAPKKYTSKVFDMAASGPYTAALLVWRGTQAVNGSRL